MKKVLVISATSYTNFNLAENVKSILDNMQVESSVINLEDYDLPLFTSSTYKNNQSELLEIISKVTEKLSGSSGLVFCAPEYNGSIPPIVTNFIAWISVSTDYWRDAFNNKISLLASSSGGSANKYTIAMKNQLEHLGSVVMPRTICISSSNEFNNESATKILKHFSKLL